MDDRKRNYIDGEWVETSSGEEIDVINPTTEEKIGSVPVSKEVDVDLAVTAARRAFPGWSETSVEERAAYLNSLSLAIKDRAEELARIITQEVGTPIGYSRMAMVGTPRVVARSYAKILEDFTCEENNRNYLIVNAVSYTHLRAHETREDLVLSVVDL